MFEKMKEKSYEEGFEQGKRKMECTHFTDSSKIAYATCAGYNKASIILDTKDKEIASLKVLVSKLETKSDTWEEQCRNRNERITELRNEVDRFYIEEIERAESVKQVEFILERYKGFSPTFGETFSDCVFKLTNSINSLFEITKKEPEKQVSVSQYAKTKIKRINRKNIYKTCELLDDEKDDAVYAHVMMSEIKEITGQEVDGKKILDAKASGLDSVGVFKSILSAYNVKQDDVMAE